MEIIHSDRHMCIIRGTIVKGVISLVSGRREFLSARVLVAQGCPRLAQKF